MERGSRGSHNLQISVGNDSPRSNTPVDQELGESNPAQQRSQRIKEINYYPSLQIALRPKPKPQTKDDRKQNSLLSIENPQGLAFAEIESTIVKKMFSQKKVKEIKKEELTKENVLEHLERDNYKMLHFTGHGSHNREHPEKSYIYLGGSDDEDKNKNKNQQLTEKEKLTAEDVSKVNLSNYLLIILSACETGLTGKQNLDYEYVGLSSSFLQSGANSVINSCWVVDEVANAWLIIRFYQLYLQGERIVEAMLQAQLWLSSCGDDELVIWLQELQDKLDGNYNVRQLISDQIKKIKKDLAQKDSAKIKSNIPRYSHPYYWASFTVSGGEI